MFTLAACGNDSSKSGASSSSSASAAHPSTAASSSAPAPAKESGDQSVVGKATVTQNEKGAKEPTVKFESPVSAEAKVGARLATEGSGDALTEGQVLSVNIAAYDAATGKKVTGADYAAAKSIKMAPESFAGGLEDVYAVMQTAKVGSDISVLIPASATGQKSQFWVMHVKEQKAAAVTWKKSDQAGDKITVAEKDGAYTLTIPQGDDPTKLKVDVIKEGTEGKAATATSKVSALYAGARYANAKQFDGNFDTKTATTFGLDQVIKGWTQGLTGLKAGSLVVLTIPKDLAYGDQAAGTSTEGALVFLVKIDKIS